MTVHAFVDESHRGGMYVVAAAVVAPTELPRVRAHLRG